MLKLLIVDDEETICLAIANIIDWAAYQIQLVGICTDGVEAYHMILDECPDIVITDIRMPGISGLELIERINRTDLHTQFVILSGYGEFEYAKRAMKCGVQHYLLKPCTEEQIIDCIKAVTSDYYASACSSLQPSRKNQSSSRLQKTLIRNIIREGLACAQIPDSFFELYDHYVDLSTVSYQLCHLYYLEQSNLTECLASIDQYCQKNIPDVDMHMVYTRNVLLIFFRNYAASYTQLDRFLEGLSFSHQTTSIEYRRISYPSLKTLLLPVIQRLKRYDLLYFIDGTTIMPNFNYGTIVERVNHLIPILAEKDSTRHQQTTEDLEKILLGVSNRDFLLQLCDNIIISLETQMSSAPFAEVSDTLYRLHKEEDISRISEGILAYVRLLNQNQDDTRKQYSPFISQLIDYLQQQYSNPDLTLKWISENYLYMNVNYVGRCFAKETGEKFSAYLMNLRVQKAKEILATQENAQIQHVAELVGCGNTPYYFSKIFKKCTGLTPSAYIKKHISQG